MKEQIDRISQILREMTDFSRPTSHRKSLTHSNQVVQSALGISKYDRRLSGIHIITSLDNEIPALKLDGDKLLQVFLNIIFNAAEAEEHKPAVTDDQHAAETDEHKAAVTEDHHAAEAEEHKKTVSDDQHASEADDHKKAVTDDHHAAETDEHKAASTDDQHASEVDDHEAPVAEAQAHAGSIMLPQKRTTLLSRTQMRGYAPYQYYCAACHGKRGNGDGVNAKNLSIPPRRHNDASYMANLTDAYLNRVIKEGGVSQGFSPQMPPWGGVLSDEEISNLIAFLRILPEARMVASAEEYQKSAGMGGHHNGGAEAEGHHAAETDDHQATGTDDH